MRKINFIVLHCTATQPTATVKAILGYWKNVLKWKNVGYHKLIQADGTVNTLASYEQVTNGVAGYNSQSIHISYIGGIDKQGKPFDSRTPQQKESLLKLVKEAKELYPNAKVLGHKDFPKVNKACPSFSVEDFLKENNI